MKKTTIHTDWQKSREKYLKLYRGFCKKTHLANHVLLLARVIAEELEQDKNQLVTLKDLINGLTELSFARRVQRLKDRIGETRIEKNEATLRNLLRDALQRRIDDNHTPEDAIQSVLHPLWIRLVFTAHPTFALTKDGITAIANGIIARAPIADKFGHALQIRDKAPLLDEEYELAAITIAATRQALKRFHVIAFEVASLFTNFKTAPDFGISGIASWVGYDSDGRSDITWADSFHKRLLARIAYLQEVSDDLNHLAEQLPHSHKKLAQTMTQLSASLARDGEISSSLLPAFKQWSGHREGGEEQTDDIELLKKAARALHNGDHSAASEGISTDPDKIGRKFDEFYKESLTIDDEKLKLAILGQLTAMSAMIREHGISTARSHMRINASQIDNALRPLMPQEDMKNPDLREKKLMSVINEQLESTKEVTINFGSLIAERLSARRMIMIMKTMIRYMDDKTPIRFLIAECESSLTLLGCLYFLRLFGIDNRVELCPLLETAQSMKSGHRIIKEFLENPHGRRYVEQQGKLTVQIGFSDSARHIGQLASALSIENLQMKIARILAEKNLSHITLLFFDTHGESVGRGGFAGAIGERPFYLCSPYARNLFCKLDIHHEQEISFQGGDGYLWFFNQQLAFASLLRMSEGYLSHYHPANPQQDVKDDPLYQQSDFAIHLAEEVRHFNETLMHDEGYAEILLLFGRSMLFPAGSRPTERNDGGGHRRIHPKPQDWRAIPQNAILQQLGMIAHVLGGIGDTLARNNAVTTQMLAQSPRFRHLMTNILEAGKWSESLVFESYPAIRSPALWSAMARHTDDPAKSDQIRSIAQLLEHHPVENSMRRIIRLLGRHYDAFDSWRCKNTHLLTSFAKSDDDYDHENFILLHALRLALLQYLYGMLLHLPDFSYQKGFDRRDLEEMILHLEVPRAIEILNRIFPLLPNNFDKDDFSTSASYESDAIKGYKYEHETIFIPMKDAHELMHKISIALMHHIGSVG